MVEESLSMPSVNCVRSLDPMEKPSNSAAQFLVQKGIDRISFNPDALIKGIENINRAEEKLETAGNEILTF